MSAVTRSATRSFIITPLGNRRIALGAESVVELVAAKKPQSFPHQTPWICGVIVRRNRVVPICEPAALFGAAPFSPRFYVITEWAHESARGWCAIPVSGECELVSAIPETLPTGDLETSTSAQSASGFISVQDGQLEVIDLGKLICSRSAPEESPAGVAP